ncbi:MAG: TraB/GumN family protein, partial [Pseudomonadota bacterium]|nr:TraB/GumN family protein [Pseudomonadota bacterium]
MSRPAFALLAACATALLTALPAGAASPPPQSTPTATEIPAEGPALWVIRDADSTVYLFGTVHMLRPDTGWQTPRIMAAFDASTDIWFEVDAAAEDNVPSLAVSYGLSFDRSLSSRLAPDDRRALAAAAGRAGRTPEQFETFRPWLAGMTVGNAPMVAAGYDAASGVEAT